MHLLLLISGNWLPANAARRPHTVIPFVLGSLGTAASSMAYLWFGLRALRDEGKLEAVISDGVRGFRGT